MSRDGFCGGSCGAPARPFDPPAPVDRPLNQLLAPRHVPILSSAPPRSPALSLASCDTLDRVEQRPRNHALSRRPDVSVPHPAVYRRTRSPAVAPRYGPIFVGVVFNILLYGIMITQTYLYFNTYKKYAASPTMPPSV